MNEPPGLPAAIGVDAVQWELEGEDRLLVHITGRWRRRRPVINAQPQLVVYARGQRHRFTAMPEPPSLTGTAPGNWRMTFSLPSSLAPHLSGATLHFGAAAVPLPAAQRVDLPEAEGELAGGGAASSARELQALELALESAQDQLRASERRAGELRARIAALEEELELAREEPVQLYERLAEEERARRAAEQNAHAERARREELQDELTQQVRDAREQASARAPEDVRERLLELEEEAEALRRRVVESEHQAAAALAGRAQGEAEAAAAVAARAELERDRQELERRVGENERQLLQAGAALQELERQLALAQSRLEESLAAGRRSAAADSESARTVETWRQEAEQHRQAAAAQREAREVAERQVAELKLQVEEHLERSQRAWELIGRLRTQMVALWGTMGPTIAGLATREPPAEVPRGQVPAPTESAPVDPDRLAAALARLREAVPPEPASPGAAQPALLGAPLPAPPAAPEPATRPWLLSPFRRLAASQPEVAGRLLLALIPAQPLVHPRPIAYDVQDELGWLHVTSVPGEARAAITRAAAPRPPEQTQFRVQGAPGELARLVLAGPLRRRLGMGVARLSGERAGLAALRDLVTRPLSIPQLHAAGVRLAPALATRLAAEVIEAAWTTGEAFTIAHQPEEGAPADAWLQVAGGRAPTAAPGPGTPTTLTGSEGTLLAVLDGRSGPAPRVLGDPRPLRLTAEWLKRAQSG